MPDSGSRSAGGAGAGLSRREVIDFLIEQATSPSHHGKLDPCDVTMVGGNPGCGDVITIYLNVEPEDDALAEVSFTGEGCTISQAAASVLLERVRGASLAEIETMDANDLMDALGREVVKSRPRCATLALSTLKGAVKQYRSKRLRESIDAGSADPGGSTGEDHR